MHAVKRIFTAWRRSVQSRVADYINSFSLARTRRRLRLKGWTSERHWHLQYDSNRLALTAACLDGMSSVHDSLPRFGK